MKTLDGSRVDTMLELAVLVAGTRSQLLMLVYLKIISGTRRSELDQIDVFDDHSHGDRIRDRLRAGDHADGNGHDRARLRHRGFAVRHV